MPNAVDIDELDASDLSDILTSLKRKPTKVKNAVEARKEVRELLEEKGLTLETDENGDFSLTAKAKTKAAPAKGKTKAKAAPEPEPEAEEEEEGEEEEEETEEEEEETEEEAEEEAEEEEEEEEEEAPPPPKKAAKKAPPAPAPKAVKGKAKAKAPEPEEEEEAEEEAEEEIAAPKKAAKKTKAKVNGDGTKRAPPVSREPAHADTAKILIEKKDQSFKDGSIRDELWGLMKSSKTVGDYMKKAAAHDDERVRNTDRGFLNVAVKEGWISVG